MGNPGILRRLPRPADPSGTALRAASTALVRRRLDLHVEGLEQIPKAGAAIIAARHFHHLYDGAAILATVPRPVHILVALDWLRSSAGRAAMERACRAAGWPVVLRPQEPSRDVDQPTAARAFRAAARESLALFDAGRILLVFPEGYPNIDPGYTPKQDEAEFLPFQRGVARLASLAAARGLTVPIVPAGFSYRRDRKWDVTLRFGETIDPGSYRDESRLLKELETRVHALSVSPAGNPDSATGERP